ncbi:MAG: FAD-dependent thymidylate synthase [Clostridia bacterium]
MRVDLIQYTPDPDLTVAMAAHLCYSPSSIEDLKKKMDESEVARLIRLLRSLGHLSPFEHAHFVVGIEGLSRVASHQLVRSRIASYSQQSQRYIDQRGFEYVTPPQIRKDPTLKVLYERHMDESRDLYRRLREAGVEREDARFVLPGAASSNIIMSKNARAWLEWFELRTCTRSQWEIRILANKIMRLLRKVAPYLFEVSGPPCVTQRLCREGKMSCGRIDKMAVERLPYKIPGVLGESDRGGDG